jgi:hypothetical protein
MGCGALFLLGDAALSGWRAVSVLIFSGGFLALYLNEGYLLGVAARESEYLAAAHDKQALGRMTPEQRAMYGGFERLKDTTQVVFNSEARVLSFMSIPLDEKRAKILARHILDGYPFSAPRLAGSSKLMSDPEFRIVRDAFVLRGLATWTDPDHHQQGCRITAKGLAWARHVLGVRPEKIKLPPLLKDFIVEWVGVRRNENTNERQYQTNEKIDYSR